MTDLFVFLMARIADDEADADRIAGAAPQFARRLRADSESKRQIVERCVRLSKSGRDRDINVARDFLVDLAEVYADHPDYDRRWRP